ncbi:multifunctional fatty acid oxidation complex subunit alpha : Multifunctional fatty acid oxidation complex subunit alpha OS=Rhodopirellula sallentina SM41 GN=RSSM_06309 PE=3 SV=1: ECH: 3HCDH_N: 3HCDH: 3HCDH [Gemmataceae bacterium]|nr:multifunctional fatty acid oxidation complex subunit alpha : Multifunctional fatty acid oxidation complex subunit alpha OS=Rhodopirellula sallentina SM41 GN=RSSM_06309 PE=3 SV=1: ECH: 3HCDH_N: 3HCDH: 3HCDH [Gemmataceae bacterium]VTT97401.1 multifunctional fatty acid oxidation complex subunit alpha : Multifunctional fatty acid oxidation complex subunit alpha OS=Rhodopirellula sallentina SM41 GN=RSSM_06309 PE=3 SV=1: ECH: 3HCDH_N: 3HCDH: 3HCDH [Gemmataceae bacterium]
MTENLKHLRIERDARGVATLTFDVQGAPFNVFNDEVIGDLRSVIDDIERDPPRVVVFRSGKASGFFAGADVNRIQQLEHADEVRAVIDAGHSTFARIERLPCPTVAVIHGPCLGGGMEFALACRHRVARDDASTKLGLPETSLGLIPGWGGTQRLPRLVGLRQALKMILEGTNLSASKAAAVGLVDVAAPADSFDATLEQFVADRLNGRSVRHPTRKLLDTLLDATSPGRAVVLASARKKIAKKARDYPALAAALHAVEVGLRTPGSAGYHAEREGFVSVVFTPVAKSLIGLFFQREKARKPSTWVRGVKPATMRKAAVVGAGTMGAGIAQLLAFNGVPVALKDISDDIVAGGMKKVAALTDAAVSKSLLTRADGEALVRRVTPTTEWGPLAGCDLVIEAVVEREDVKRTVFKELAEKLGPDAVLASNTSALSVSRIAESTPHAERVAGLHFFNPVHRMQLVEVVRGRDTDDATVATLVELVRKVGKVPVVVADSPGFLVNRTLFPYLDEAVRLVLEGVPGEEVDRAAVRFGMPMGPLELLDQIGIDIAADVSKTFASLTSDPGPVPERFAEMVAAGALGKKAGRGFYQYDGDRRRKLTAWATPKRARKPEGAAAGELSEVQMRLVYPMINEAAKCLETGVVAEAWMADLAMVLGTGFAPFRGGPLRTADTLGVARVVRELDELRAAHGPRFEPAGLLRHLADGGHGFYTEARALAHV